MTFTALLLTGGESRRMRRDKATLVIGGEPLWLRQLGLLRELRSEMLRLSARVSPAWCPPDVETVLDTPPSRGPLSGVAAALQGLQTSHLLVLAIDLPHMTAGHLRKLRAAAQPGCGVIPVRDGRFEPLCAIYPVEAAPAAEAVLKGDDVSLQTFAKALLHQSLIQPHTLSPEEELLYLNTNTPDDLP